MYSRYTCRFFIGIENDVGPPGHLRSRAFQDKFKVAKRIIGASGANMKAPWPSSFYRAPGNQRRS